MQAFLSKYLVWVEVFGVVAIVLFLNYGTWYVTSDHYKKLAAQEQVKQDAAVQKQLLANQALLADNLALRKSAEEDHAKNQLIVNDLADQLARLRVHIPLRGCPVSKGGTASKDSDRSAGILQQKVDDAFARLQQRVTELVTRCDQLNIDAIQSNESVR